MGHFLFCSGCTRLSVYLEKALNYDIDSVHYSWFIAQDIFNLCRECISNEMLKFGMKKELKKRDIK